MCGFMHKFFEQIPGPLVYVLAEAAGMPMKVFNAQKKYVEALLIYTTTAGGMGHAFRRNMAYHKDARYR